MSPHLTTSTTETTPSEMSVGESAGRAAEVVPQLGVLEGDEIVELLIKPSLWYVASLSVRWIAIAGITAALAAFASDSSVALRTYLIQIAAIVSAARVGYGILQWSSRFYLLTNRRVMRIKGVLRADWRSCPLRDVGEIVRIDSPGQKFVKLGALRIHHANPDKLPIHWNFIRKPNEVERIVNDAVRRARSGNGTP
ncbi:MAG: PH domain-containing protein [Phycisphaerae bacterium]